MMSLAFIPTFSLSDLPDFLSAARYWASSFIYLQDARQGEEKEGRALLLRCCYQAGHYRLYN